MNNLLNGTAAYSRILEYHDKLISLSPHEICIANLGTYKREDEYNDINSLIQQFDLDLNLGNPVL